METEFYILSALENAATIASMIGLLLVILRIRWGFVVGLVASLIWIPLMLYVTRGISLGGPVVVVTQFLWSFVWLFGVYKWFYKKNNNAQAPDEGSRG